MRPGEGQDRDGNGAQGHTRRQEGFFFSFWVTGCYAIKIMAFQKQTLPLPPLEPIQRAKLPAQPEELGQLVLCHETRREKNISSFYNKKGTHLSCSFAVWETDSPQRGPTTFMLTHTGKTAPAGNPHAALLSESLLPVISEIADPRAVNEVLRPDDKTEATRL